MITIEEFKDILSDLIDELPKEFFDELNGGIIVQEEAKFHPKVVNDDLYIMGEYQNKPFSTGKCVVLYYGSFEKVCYNMSREQIIERMREVLRHEFRHHMEGRSGLRDLEVEDEINIKKYLDARKK